MVFEDLLEDAGGFGLYQKLLCFVFLVSAMANAGISYWTQIFIMILPKQNCLNSTLITTILNGTNSTSITEEYKCPVIPENFTGCTNGWEFDYVDFFPTVTSEFGWICAESYKPYLVHTTFWIGSVCGFFVTGIISDRYGRKFTMLILECIMIVSNIVTIFMTTHIQFAIIRFITGMTVLTSSTLAFLMTIEYTGVKQRTFIGVMQGVGWSLMAVVAPWIAYIVRDWRWLLGICCFPSVVCLIILLWVPESASWLLTRGKKERALDILEHIAKVNGRKVQENHFRKEMNKTGLGDIEKPSSKEIFRSIISVVKTENLRRNLALLLIMWFIVSMCYNGIMIQIGTLPTNHFVSYSMGAIVELMANIYFGIAAETLGRRWANFVTNIFGAIIATSIYFVPKDARILDLVLTLIARLAWAASYDVTLQYSAELLPTAIRGRGVSLQLMIGDLGNALAPFVVFLNIYDAHYPMMVFGVISIAAAFLSLTLPETSTEALPQTILDGKTFGTNQSFWWTCPIIIKKKKKTESNGKQVGTNGVLNGKHISMSKDDLIVEVPSKDSKGHVNLAYSQFVGETENSKL